MIVALPYWPLIFASLVVAPWVWFPGAVKLWMSRWIVIPGRIPLITPESADFIYITIQVRLKNLALSDSQIANCDMHFPL